MTHTIAVIPARGGSKRVPKKNIREFCGKSIIAYTIEAAQDSGIFDKIVVSTDDPLIAEVSKEYGAEVPFLREPNISDDFSPVSLATLDALERLDPKGKDFTHVAQLMANCPLRDAKDIINSYHQFIETDVDSQISVTRYLWMNPWWAMKKDEYHYLNHVFEDVLNKRSQDLPELFCPTGAIWWAKTEKIREEKTFYTRKCGGWETSWQHGIDIDTEDDWLIAEILFKMGTEIL